MERKGHILGVDHHILGGAGMHTDAMDSHHRRGRVKVLVFNLSRVSPVHRVGVGSTKMFHIEQVRALPHFLVRGKADAQFAVGPVLHDDALQHGHDLRDARLVIGAQQCGPVGGDEGLPLHLLQKREIRHPHHIAGAGQHHIAAVILFMQDGIDILAGGGVRGVHMGDKSKPFRRLTARSGGQRGVHIAVLVHAGVRKAQLLQLFHQQLCQIKLAHGGGMGGAGFVRGGVHFRVGQQSFVCSHSWFLLYFEVLRVFYHIS